MKFQQLALGLALVVAGSAFAATSRDVTVTRVTPHGTVTKHVVRTSGRADMHHRNVRKVVVVHHPVQRHVKKVVIVHPAHHYNHNQHAVNRTVVIHRRG
jgi:hypothetical protein